MEFKRNTELVKGNARTVGQDPELINITINQEDFLKCKPNKAGFVHLHLKQRRREDQYGNTHIIIKGHSILPPSPDIIPDNNSRSELDFF